MLPIDNLHSKTVSKRPFFSVCVCCERVLLVTSNSVFEHVQNGVSEHVHRVLKIGFAYVLSVCVSIANRSGESGWIETIWHSNGNESGLRASWSLPIKKPSNLLKISRALKLPLSLTLTLHIRSKYPAMNEETPNLPTQRRHVLSLSQSTRYHKTD